MHTPSYLKLYFQVLYLYELLILSGYTWAQEECKQLRISLTTHWISFGKDGVSDRLQAENQEEDIDSDDLDVLVKDWQWMGFQVKSRETFHSWRLVHSFLRWLLIIDILQSLWHFFKCKISTSSSNLYSPNLSESSFSYYFFSIN